MQGYCIKLNSIVTARPYTTPEGSIYVCHLGFAPGAVNPTVHSPQQISADPWLGQAETQRYARRKNVIWDSYFVNHESERGWESMVWRQSLRALDVEALTVLMVLPSTTDAINQSPDDELYLPPVNATSYTFDLDHIAHMLRFVSLLLCS